MTPSAQETAHKILDVTPIVIQAIRFEMRSQKFTDLSVPQFRTLAYIRRNPGTSLSDTAEFIGLTLSSMSILVNGLVERGLVERQTSAQDRRRITLTLTEEGESILSRALTKTESRLAEMVSGLTDAERATIHAAMDLLRPLFLPRSLTPPPSAEAAGVSETIEEFVS